MSSINTALISTVPLEAAPPQLPCLPAGARTDVEARHARHVQAAFDGTGAPVRLRRARLLDLALQGSRFRVSSPVTHHAITGGNKLIGFLAALGDWTPSDRLCGLTEALADKAPSSAQVIKLVERGFVVAEHSPFAALDQRLAESWEWGPEAVNFHLAIRDVVWASPERATADAAGRAVADQGPVLSRRHDGDCLELPPVDLARAPYDVMAERTSVREFGETPISAETLGRILHAGVGVKEWSDQGVFGVLPMTMTPSGGARNPYEAYVISRNVAGIGSGCYHYSATQHSLEFLADAPPHLSSVMADLAWVNDAAAVVILVADVERTMFKYKHPTAYRVVLIEAGHIAQNMLLAATSEQLASIPIAAFNDAAAEQTLALDPAFQLATHAVVLGTST